MKAMGDVGVKLLDLANKIQNIHYLMQYLRYAKKKLFIFSLSLMLK